jgi:hypothetical protein
MVETFPIDRLTDRKLNELSANGSRGYGVDAVREEMRQRINKWRQLRRSRDPDYHLDDIPPEDSK